MTAPIPYIGTATSQSPRIGAVIRIQHDWVRNFWTVAAVSIPSNRGSHSNEYVQITSGYKDDRLNPLESGQSFEFHLELGELGKVRFVSIPSNRGSHSNELAVETDIEPPCLNPLESGQSFE